MYESSHVRHVMHTRTKYLVSKNHYILSPHHVLCHLHVLPILRSTVDLALLGRWVQHHPAYPTPFNQQASSEKPSGRRSWTRCSSGCCTSSPDYRSAPTGRTPPSDSAPGPPRDAAGPGGPGSSARLAPTHACSLRRNSPICGWAGRSRICPNPLWPTPR